MPLDLGTCARASGTSVVVVPSGDGDDGGGGRPSLLLLGQGRSRWCLPHSPAASVLCWWVARTGE